MSTRQCTETILVGTAFFTIFYQCCTRDPLTADVGSFHQFPTFPERFIVFYPATNPVPCDVPHAGQPRSCWWWNHIHFMIHYLCSSKSDSSNMEATWWPKAGRPNSICIYAYVYLITHTLYIHTCIYIITYVQYKSICKWINRIIFDYHGWVFKTHLPVDKPCGGSAKTWNTFRN